MIQDGNLVLVFVAIVGVIGMVLVAAAASAQRKNRAQTSEQTGSASRQKSNSSSPKRGGGSARGGKGGGADLEDQALRGELARAQLRIPPPDEPRIEAVAPKNDVARRL